MMPEDLAAPQTDVLAGFVLSRPVRAWPTPRSPPTSAAEEQDESGANGGRQCYAGGSVLVAEVQGRNADPHPGAQRATHRRWIHRPTALVACLPRFAPLSGSSCPHRLTSNDAHMCTSSGGHHREPRQRPEVVPSASHLTGMADWGILSTHFPMRQFLPCQPSAFAWADSDSGMVQS